MYIVKVRIINIIPFGLGPPLDSSNLSRHPDAISEFPHTTQSQSQRQSERSVTEVTSVLTITYSSSLDDSALI